MKFDQTYIAIRIRGVLEILDLSLHVIRDHFVPLLVLWLVGVIPLAVIDWWATRWMTADYFELEYLALYFFTMSLLIVNQAQVATSLMTIYLGQAMFSQRPSIFSCLKGAMQINPWFLFLHGIYRGIVPAFATVLLMHEDITGDEFAALYTLFVALVFSGLLVRCLRPFVNEILLLEKTPVRAKYPHQITYKTRSSGLHGVADRDRLGRFLTHGLYSVFFTISFFGTIMLIDSWMNLHTGETSIPALIYLPLSMWMVAGIFAVVRYLSYIDLRIRQEGWEVELRMRTEAMRVEKALS